MRLLLLWLLNALALVLVAHLVPGVEVRDPWHAMIAALVLGLVNTLIRPVLVLLTLPITVLTLGLFLLVINALMFWGVGSVLSGFRVEGFWPALLGALAYSVLTWLLSQLLPGRSR